MPAILVVFGWWCGARGWVLAPALALNHAGIHSSFRVFHDLRHTALTHDAASRESQSSTRPLARPSVVSVEDKFDKLGGEPAHGVKLARDGHYRGTDATQCRAISC